MPGEVEKDSRTSKQAGGETTGGRGMTVELEDGTTFIPG